MTCKEFLKKLEDAVSPVSLSDEFCKKYSMYDNSGIVLDCGGEICGAVFSLDFSNETVAKAEKLGYNLIVTHHPAIYGGIRRLDLNGDPQAGALAECIRRGISVISMHINFDVAPNGIDYYLAEGLGGKEICGKETLQASGVGAYGRIYEIGEVVFDKYISDLSERFSTKRLLGYGGGRRIIKKVASFCGAGSGDGAIEFAKSNGADVFVSSDMKHHELTKLVELGINVVCLTHYSAENYGFKHIYHDIKDGLNLPTCYFVDERFL